MRKVNKDTRGNNQKVKNSQGSIDMKHHVGDLKPKRVPSDWAMEWGAGLALWETWGGLIWQGCQDL